MYPSSPVPIGSIDSNRVEYLQVRDVEFELVRRTQKQVWDLRFEPIPVQSVRGTGNLECPDQILGRAADRDPDRMRPDQ